MPFRRQVLLYLNLLYPKRPFIFRLNNKLHFPWQSRNALCRRLWFNNNYFCSGNISDIQIMRINTIATKHVCWNCNQCLETTTLFCDSCRCLQPVNKHSNYFKVMDVENVYNINIRDLKQKFRNLQSLLHPDKFSSKSKKEQDLSEEFSSHVNKAYTTLLDPLERGLYMLNLQNISIEEGSTEMDKEFLMEIMEINEEIENERNPQKLADFYTTNKKQIDALVREVKDAFDKGNVQLAKTNLTKMKYYYSIDKKIKEIKQKHDIPD